MTPLIRRLRLVAMLLFVLTIIAALAATRLWQERPDIADLGWPQATSIDGIAGSVTVTWFGISTLLFDDGETQVLIDGTFTRVPVSHILTLRRITSDVGTINHSLAKYRINRVTTIVPVHSHFDHAIDAGHVANRSTAIVLGSESTANIARGADVPVDQYQILADGESRQFGAFTITLLDARHAPTVIGDEGWLPGTIEVPLEQPARITAWREGGSYSILIGHPRGTTLVQASGGYLKNKLRGITADIVILGIGGLACLGREYVKELWHETVTAVGARRLFPVHYDDFTKPLGEIRLFPSAVDNTVRTAGWITEIAAEAENPVDISLLPFGEAIVLY